MQSSLTSLRPYTLAPGEVDLATLRAIYQGELALSLDAAACEAIERAQRTVADILATGEVVYGINTGFGKLANTRIPVKRLAELQRNLVLSHSVGVGKELADNVVRLIMATKILSLSRGHSGIRMEVID